MPPAPPLPSLSYTLLIVLLEEAICIRSASHNTSVLCGMAGSSAFHLLSDYKHAVFLQASKALEQLHSTSASQRAQLFWINYIEQTPGKTFDTKD